ncbi:MAG TPA: hypothetical protein VF005_05750 [Acidimicrobiales bacterium]
MKISFRRVAAAALGLAVGVVALGGCASAHNSLGTGSSACFQALPSATTAVHNKGKLLGVRRVSQSQLRRPPSTAPAQTSTSEPPTTMSPSEAKRSVCVVAFQGKFAPGDVDHQTVPRSGNYAIVVVGEHGGQPLRAFVTDRLPLRFRHLS